MPGPWEKYNQIAPAKAMADAKAGPWAKYSQPEEPVGGAAVAGLESLGRGAAFGLAPYLSAGAEQAMYALTPESDVNKKLSAEGFNVQEKTPSFVESRDAFVDRAKKQEEQYPTATTAGELAGLVSSAPIAGAGLRLLPGLGAPAASGFGRIAQGVGSGAAVGLLQTPEPIKGEMDLQIPERLQQAEFGAASGGLVQGAGEGVRKLGAGLGKFAEERAFKAAGATASKKDKSLIKFGKANKIGRSLIDEGILKPGDTYDDVLEKTTAAKKQAGEAIGQIYDDTFSSKKPAILKDLTSKESVSGLLHKAVEKSSVKPTIGRKAYDEKMNGIIDDLVTGSEDLSDPRAVNGLIGELDDQINYSIANKEMKPVQKGLLAMRQKLRQVVNVTVRKTATELGDKEKIKELKKLNQLYGNLSEAQRMSEEKVARETANRFFSPSDYGIAGVGAVGGAVTADNPEEAVKRALLGAGAGLAHRTARRYVNPFAVYGSDIAGKGLLRAPQLSPTTSGAIGSRIMNKIRE